MSMRLWLLVISVKCVTLAKDDSSMIMVKCTTCERSDRLVAEQGGRMTVQFLIQHLRTIKVYFTNIIIFADGRTRKVSAWNYVNRRIDISPTLKNSGCTSQLSLTLTDISLDDDGKVFAYEVFTNDGVKHIGTKMVVVTIPPVFTNDVLLEENYIIKEHGDLQLYLTIRSNPPCSVSAVFGDRKLQVFSSNLRRYIKKYYVLLKNLTRENCGEKLLIEAVTQEYKINRTIDLNVLFTPHASQNVKYKRAFTDCSYNGTSDGNSSRINNSSSLSGNVLIRKKGIFGNVFILAAYILSFSILFVILSLLVLSKLPKKIQQKIHVYEEVTPSAEEVGQREEDSYDYNDVILYPAPYVNTPIPEYACIQTLDRQSTSTNKPFIYSYAKAENNLTFKTGFQPHPETKPEYETIEEGFVSIYNDCKNKE